MKPTSVLLGFAAHAAAAALGDNLPLPLGEIGWVGSVTPGGPELEYWGIDFEEIEAKIQKDYPGFSIYSDEPSKVSELPEETNENPANTVRSILEARQGKRLCSTRFGEVNPFQVNTGINALRKITAGCKARGRTCIRTQCRTHAAIGLCNDNTYEINIPCPQIATMAEKVKNDCYTHDVSCSFPSSCRDVNPRTAGQMFSPGGTWNVIVGYCTFFGNGERPVRA
ncbi:hypothetical protein ACHAQH_007977 [Verticillium albo-atrum]